MRFVANARTRNTAITARIINRGRFILFSFTKQLVYDDFTRRTMVVPERFPWLQPMTNSELFNYQLLSYQLPLYHPSASLIACFSGKPASRMRCCTSATL